jgi:chitodextrinase
MTKISEDTSRILLQVRRLILATPHLFTARPQSNRLAVSCAIVGMGVTGAIPAHAAAPATLVGSASERCLDIAKASLEPRTPAIIYDCHGGPNQQWEFTSAGELRTFNGARCLDIRGGSTQPQAIVQSYPCNGGANQKWTLRPDKTIVNPKSGLCLTVKSAGTDNLTAIDTWRCEGTTHQQWSVVETIPSTDTQAPTPPGSLTISALTCRSATLAWEASTDNIGIAYYDIYRDGQALDTVNASTLATQIVLVPGANWGVYVNARDAAGNVSQASTSLRVIVPQCQADTQPPSVPGDLQGAVSGTTVRLNWTASSDNVAVTAYYIYRNNIVAGTSTVPGYTDSGLLANTLYNYAVAASDAQGNISPRGAALSLTTGSACTDVICSTVQVADDTDIPWGLVALPDGTVLYTRRDAQNSAYAQDVRHLSGKVLRLNPNGTAPVDNPFGNYVWSYGHRNPQGLAFDSLGRLWEQEFGDSQDETNLIVKGGNYGWPNCEGIISRSGSGCATTGYVAPKYTYRNTEGSCSGIAIIRDSLYVACLAGKRLYRGDIRGDNLANVQQFFVGTYDRLRTVEPAVDGNLWMTNSDAVGDKDSIPNNTDTKIFKVILKQ